MLSDIFCCPICKTCLEGWPPSLKCPSCGHTIQKTDEGILVFTDDPNLKLDGERQHIGYDTIANSYAQCLYPPELDKQMNVGYGKAIAELVGPGRIVLDIGCGPGKYDVEVAKRGCRLIAGDISLNMLKILSPNLRNTPAGSIIPCRLNAYSLPLLDQSVDAVMAMSFLCFVGDPPQVIGEIKRVLKPGGTFITNGRSDISPSDDIVSEISKARQYYSELLKEKGGKELKILGWSWTCRQIWENLPKFFRECQVVESDDLIFRYTSTPGWFLKRLGSRYTAFQIEVDQVIHEEVMREIRDRLISEYGRNFEDIEQEYCRTDRLIVCRG